MRNPNLTWKGIGAVGVLGSLLLAARADDPPLTSPRLSLEVTNPQSDVLSWPQSARPFYLEQSSALEPLGVWTPVNAAVVEDETTARVVLPKSEGFRFFQLRHDPDLPTLLLDHGRKLAADLALQDTAAQEYLDLPFLDPFEPRRLAPLHGVPRITAGGFVLNPGLWEIPLQTFCLKTGTPGPGAGDGYLPASFAGPRADLLHKVLEAFSLDPDADQESTQILLWAMVLRTRLDTLPASIQTLAQRWLSADDIGRLNLAADRKAAHEAAFAERYKRLLLGPGGLFENLPQQVKDALQWDAEVEAALGRATEMSYEDIQNLAFAAAPPPIPTDPPREIPYGRWAWMPTSNHPAGGYLARFLVLWYAETLVQFCVPEDIIVETDGLGRITRLADLVGNEIRTTYATVPPLLVTGDPGITGHAFDVILLKGPPDWDDPRRLLETAHQGTGWVFTGMPAGGGTPGSGGRFPDPAGRYAFALEQKAEIQRLDTELSRVHPGRPPGRPGDAARLLNLAHYCEGLRLALLAAEPDDDPDFPHLSDRLGLAYRAWVSEFARLCAGEAGGTLAATAGRTSTGLHSEPGSPAPAGAPRPGWGARLKYFLSSLFGSGRKPIYLGASNSGQQNLGFSYRPAVTPVQNYQTLNQQYQQALAPVDKLFWFLPMPNFLKVPRKVIDQGISWQLPWWEYAGNKIANPEGNLKKPWFRTADTMPPPASGARLAAGTGRSDYNVPTVEHLWDFGPIEADPDISPQRLEATRTLIQTMQRVSAHLRAATVAMDRQAGAFQAGDAEWYRLQAAYAVYQERAAGVAMWDAADAIEAWTQVLRDEGTDDPWVTKVEIEESLQRLRTDGFTEDIKAGFRAAGLTEAEIEECRQVSLSWSPDLDGYPLFGTLEGATGALREFGAWLQQFPVPFPAGGN